MIGFHALCLWYQPTFQNKRQVPDSRQPVRGTSYHKALGGSSRHLATPHPSPSAALSGPLAASPPWLIEGTVGEGNSTRCIVVRKFWSWRDFISVSLTVAPTLSVKSTPRVDSFSCQDHEETNDPNERKISATLYTRRTSAFSNIQGFQPQIEKDKSHNC